MKEKTFVWETQEEFLEVLYRKDEIGRLHSLISQNISDLTFIKRGLISSSEQELLIFIDKRLSELRELKGFLV